MANDIAHHDEEARRFGRSMLVAAIVLFCLALGLWAYYGSAVFLNVMSTAWSYCF